MPKLNIYTIENLSKRSGLPQDFLLILLNLDHKGQKKYFHDHKDSDKIKGKYIRVVQYGSNYMRKFQEWLGNELSKFDNELLFTINGGVKKKSILNAIDIHIRNKPFTFVKSDLSGFFESVPKERVFSLFCGLFNCGKDVAQIICNSICFNVGPIGIKGANSNLGRGLHCSSRVAIWCSIQFFRKFYEDISNKYKILDPKISYYVDDIGISIMTTDEVVAKSFLDDMKQLPKKKYGNIDFLQLHEGEKTNYKILLMKDDFAEYLGSRIYINRKDVSIEGINKGRVMYHQAQKIEDKKEKAILLKKVGERAKYRKRIQAK